MDLSILDALRGALASDERFALVTVIDVQGSVPRHTGAKMLVFENGEIQGTIGGGSVEAEAIRSALAAIGAGRSTRERFVLAALGKVCGGAMEVFIEPMTRTGTLYVFGGGHIALPLYRIARLCDIPVVVADDRPEFVSEERFPDARRVLLPDYGDLHSAGVDWGFRDGDAVALVTRGIEKSDGRVLRGLIESGVRFTYLGMVGSRTKIRLCMQDLVRAGVPEARLREVRTPIGLDVGTDVPAEIAVGIMAEFLMVKNRKTGRPLAEVHAEDLRGSLPWLAAESAAS